ncbi:MAG: hypothetical protein ACE37K_22455 [Planctomycetota bacterium]
MRTPGSTSRSSTRSTSRPGYRDTSRPSSSFRSSGRSSARTSDTRPNNSNTNRSTRTRSGSSDARYRSRTSRPSVTRTPADVRAGSRTSRSTRPISERYRPADVAGSRAPRAGVTRAPTGRTGRLAPRTAPSPVTSSALAGTAPRLGSPRLGAPVGYGTANRYRNGSFVGRGWAAVGYRGGVGLRNVWGGYWGWNNNWCYNGFGGGFGGAWGGPWGGNFGRIGFGWNRPFGYGWASRWSLCGWGWGGFSPWTWNVGLLGPYYAWHNNYWSGCYRSAYWTGWSVPNTLPANYWWYPTTTYCPTYLYVPSTAVVDDGSLEPVYDGGTEVIVAGSDIGGGDVGSRARVDDGSSVGAPRVADEPESAAMTLAGKYVELGDFYFRAKRYNDAAEAYAKARNYLPEDASVHLVLADAVFANGDYHYAAFLIAEAVRLEPGIVTADTDKRTFYDDRAEFDRQVEALQNYCTEKPYDAWAQLLLGYNLRFSERPARAIVSFRRVLELDRDNPTARAFLSDLEPKDGADAPAEKRDR